VTEECRPAQSRAGPRNISLPDPTAAVLILGDEILSGEVPDENAAYLSRRLWKAGVIVGRIVFLPDGLPVISDEIRAVAPRFTYVFVTGGIGPTHDDRTRAAVAEALGLPLSPHPEAEAFLRRGYGEALTAADAGMAQLPAGAELLRGNQGRAFGFRVRNVHVFPGVPFLLRDLFERILPEIRTTPYLVRELWTESKEGVFSCGLAGVQARFPGVRIGSYPTAVGGRYRSRILLRCRDASDLAACEEAVSEALRACGADPRTD
jgi:molybdopterin-biosynthesis enzyme MoeA-like protein